MDRLTGQRSRGIGNGGGGGGGGGPIDPAASTTVYVDNNRSDSYTETGTNEKPFKTGSAAIVRMLAIAATEPAGALVFAPGDYDEALSFTPPGAFALGISGYGRQGQARIRELFLNSAGAGALQVEIDHLALGGLSGVGAAATLEIGAGAGAIFLALGQCDISKGTDGGSVVTSALLGGVLSIRLADTQVGVVGTPLTVAGWVQGRGVVVGSGELGGFNSPALVLSGAATTCALDRVALIVRPGAAFDVDCVRLFGGVAAATFANVRAEPVGAGEVILDAGAATITMAGLAVVTGDGSGGITTGGGVLISDAVNMASGFPEPILITGAIGVLGLTPAVQLSSVLVGGGDATADLVLSSDGTGGVYWAALG